MLVKLMLKSGRFGKISVECRIFARKGPLMKSINRMFLFILHSAGKGHHEKSSNVLSPNEKSTIVEKSLKSF